MAHLVVNADFAQSAANKQTSWRILLVQRVKVFPTSQIHVSNAVFNPQTWGQPVDKGIKDIYAYK